MATAAENRSGNPFVDNYRGFLDDYRRKSAKFLIDTFPEFSCGGGILFYQNRKFFEKIS